MPQPNIQLYNTLSRRKDEFKPLHTDRIGMYVCGPTVYDTPHIGNARAVVVYDVLFRLLEDVYGKTHKIEYVRNITDVDDKINQAAKDNGETIQSLTTRITEGFHADMAALCNLPPSIEPRATEHIAEMITLIEQLIARDHAYEAGGHVYFSVASDPNYGQLARRNRDEMIAGARVEVSDDKRDPGDFVLWKPASEEDDPSAVFESPWGNGRPGWHIECTAMSQRYLGETFDIHGGGADLMFPHHTNEIAQGCCAAPGSEYARYWVHNGFLTVEGEKMSKSLGNFITVRSLLEGGAPGEVIRYVLLATHYRKPLDWNEKALSDAKKALDSFYRVLQDTAEYEHAAIDASLLAPITEALCDDLNLPEAIAQLHQLVTLWHKAEDVKQKQSIAATLKQAGVLMGFLGGHPASWLQQGEVDATMVEEQIALRLAAKQQKNFAEADRIRDALKEQGIILEDKPGQVTIWRTA